MTVVLTALFIAAAVATAVVTAGAVRAERDRDVEAVNDAAERFGAAMQTATAALSGVDVLAFDGTVTDDEFAAFADDVVRVANFTALAYSPVVEGDDRDTWERHTGLAIVDTDGQGGFRSAAERERYSPVTLVYPQTDAARAVLGFDLSGDPARGRGVQEAAERNESVVVGPIRLAGSGRPGVFVIHAVRDAGGGVIGSVASGINVSTVLEASGLSRPVGVRIDGAVVLPGGHGPIADVVVGPRVFTLQTDDADGIAWGLPIAAATATLIGAAAAFRSRRRVVAERARAARAHARAAGLAELADVLAGANTVEATLTVGLDQARAVVGSSYANVAMLDPSDATKVVVVHDGDMSASLAGKYAVQRRDDRLPLIDCLDAGIAVVVPDPKSFAARYPDVVEDLRAAGIAAIVCHPVTVGRGEVVGAAGFAFTRALSPDDVRDALEAAAAAADVIGRALERSRARDAARDHAEQLSAFAASLATAHTPVDVAVAVELQLPTLFGVRSIELVHGRSPDGPGPLRYPLPSAADGSHLRVDVAPPDGWDATSDALARTVVQLVDAAWARARQHQQEHAVLQRLQHSLLATAPDVVGLDIAVAYRSALDAVGIGGDWYSVVDRPDVTYFVVGDVAGHGPEAVAVMAEVKSITRYLLSTGTPIDEALRHADAVLARRGNMASMAIVCVDHAAARLTYLNAGHPYPIVRSNDGRSDTLTKTHRPLVGIGGPTPAPTAHDFGPGDTLVLYTDGLVEQRGVEVTDGIGLLAEQIAAWSPGSCADLVEHLLDHRTPGRTARTAIDDDIALVAVRRIV